MRGFCTSLAGLLLVVPSYATPKPTPPRPVDVNRTFVLALQDGTLEERIKALDTIRTLGANAVGYVPIIVSLLDNPDTDARVKSSIVQTLQAIGPDAKVALPVLRKEFNAHTGYSAGQYAYAILAVGDGNEPEVVRWFCATANEGRSKSGALRPLLDKHPATVLPHVADLVHDENRAVAHRALRYLRLAVISRDAKSKPLIDELPPTVRTKIMASVQSYYQQPKHANSTAIVGLAAEVALRLDPRLFDDVLPMYMARLQHGQIDPADFGFLLKAHPSAPDRVLAYFEDRNPNYRLHLAVSFRDVYTPEIQQAMARQLRHPNSLIREGILETLRHHGAMPKHLRKELVLALRDPQPDLRLRAATLLVENRLCDAPTVSPTLLALTDSTTKAVRCGALQQLRQLGAAAVVAKPQLLRLTRHPDLETRYYAATALRAVDPSASASAVRPLIDVVKRTEHEECLQAIIQLGECGPMAKTAFPALRGALEYHTMRVHVGVAMWKIDPTCSTEVLGVMSHALNGNDGECLTVLEVLPKFGSDANALLPKINELIDFEDDDEIAAKAAAVSILLDPKQADHAYNRFREVLTNTRRSNGAWLSELPGLGAALKPILPELIAGTRSTRPAVRRWSCEALGRLGADAKDALPALQEAIKANNNGKHPEEALKKIQAALKH